MKTLRINSRWTQMRAWVTAAPGLLILFVLIIYPLAALLLQTVLPHLYDVHMSWKPSLKPLIEVFSDKLNLEAVANSFLVGIIAAIAATILGTITAFGTYKLPRTWKVILDLGIWIVFFTPSYVIAQGWMILMQDGGILAQVFGLHNGWSAWFFTRFGLVIAMGLRYFPFVHFAMTQSIQNIGPEFTQAAQLLGGNRRLVFLRITLPLMTPAILAGASIAFAEGFGDFGFAAAITPQTNIPLITYQIYTSLNQAPVDYSSAAGLSLLLILVTAGALWLQMWWMRRRSYTTITAHSKVLPSTTHSSRVSVVAIASLVVAGIALILPVGATICASLWKTWSGGIASDNWTLHHYVKALHLGGDGAASLGRSFVYSVVAAFVTMIVGLFVAYQMAFRKSAATRIANIITISTIAVPGVVLAAGFIFAWNALWLVPIHLVLYGTSICLGMAYIAGSIPYAIRLQLGAMSQLSESLLKAAQVLGAKQWVVLRKVVLPLVGATAVSTFFMTLTGTMFELPASSLLYPAGQPPFPVTIAGKFNAFEWSQGSALTVIGMTVVMGTYVIGRYFVSRLGRVPDATPSKRRRLRGMMSQSKRVAQSRARTMQSEVNIDAH